MQVLNEPKNDNIIVPKGVNPTSYIRNIGWKESCYCMDEGHIVQFKDKKTGRVFEKFKKGYENHKLNKKTKRWVNK